MIFKGTNPSPVYVSHGRDSYSVSVYSSTKCDAQGVIEHHYKTFRTKYQSYFAAEDAEVELYQLTSIVASMERNDQGV